MIYSPTQTETYIFCPMYRALRQEGWRGKVIGPREVGAALGKAFAVGMAAHNTGDGDALSTGLTSLEEEVKQLEGGDLSIINALPARLTKAITNSIAYDPIPSSWEKRHVEFTLPNSGDSRIDLGCWDGQSSVVVDYKLRLKLDSRYRMAEIRRLHRSWQMLHYTFFYQQYLKQEIDRYIVILAVLEPRFEIIPLDLTTVWVTSEELEQWYSFAKQTWSDMEAEDKGERVVRGKTECENRFGQCEFVDACWAWHYDESLMGQKYIKSC